MIEAMMPPAPPTRIPTQHQCLLERYRVNLAVEQAEIQGEQRHNEDDGRCPQAVSPEPTGGITRVDPIA
jgi:hypothetical protein